MLRRLGTMLAMVVALSACGPPPASPPSGPAPAAGGAAPTSAEPTAPDEATEGAIWFEVLGISQQAGELGEIDLALDAGQLAELWDRQGFDGTPPDPGFDEHVVLVAVRAEDACPDELVEVTVTDGVLEGTYLPPPGVCAQPLLSMAYAVALHRADLPEELTVLLREHEGHGADKTATFSLPPYDGPPAPPPTSPPRQRSDEEIDAVFEGHELRRCGEMPDFRTEVVIDGGVSDDPEVAAVQRSRAEMALPSDEDLVRTLLADPDADQSFGFPMTPEEHDAVMGRNSLGLGEALEGYRAEHRDTYGFTLIDQPGGGIYVLGFTDDLDGHRERLAERFPDAPIRVERAPARQADLEAAQAALNGLMGDDERPHILHSGSGGPFLHVGVLDPTREDLDAIAAIADPAFTCIEVISEGLPVETGIGG